MRAGVAWQGGVPSVHNVIVGLDSDYLLDEKLFHVNLGVEYFWVKTYGARIGYQYNRGDQGGITMGFGYRWKGRMLIDYAWDLGDKVGIGQRFTLSYRFGGVPPSVRGRQRRPFIETARERETCPDLEQR